MGRYLPLVSDLIFFMSEIISYRTEFPTRTKEQEKKYTSGRHSFEAIRFLQI